MVVDRETLRFLAVNRAAIEQYGYARGDFATMRPSDLRPPEDLPVLEALLDADSTAMGDAVAMRHRRKDGTVFDAEITVDSLEFEGRPARLVLAHDVTEQCRARAALERAHAALAASNAELTTAVAVAEATVGRGVRKPDSCHAP